MTFSSFPGATRALAGLTLATGLALTAPALGPRQAQAVPQDAGYADLVERIAPAVVYIETTVSAAETPQQGLPFPLPPGSPLEDFFERFGPPGQTPPEREQRGVGSGFIIGGNGEIVTNNHVVQGASEVRVQLIDGRSFRADVVGTDPLTDIALLRIRDQADFPSVEFGSSDEVRPGDAVIAVGNPFGLGGTVTSGIVSATSRNINAGPYDDFIQTDAAINRGNSGGPLFNVDGEVIGVNTAIFSPSGGSVGIGFAVPSDIVTWVIGQIRETGSVERGWIGVQIQQVTREIAQALGLEDPRGALVSMVTPGSPAREAGLQQGDVIVEFNGQAIKEMSDLPRIVAALSPGETADVAIIRDGERKQLEIEIRELDLEQQQASAGPDGSGKQAEKLGAVVTTLDDRIRSQLRLPESLSGAVVTEVDPDGPAANHLRPGDVVTHANGQPVESAQDLASVIEETSGKSVLLLVNRGGSALFVGVPLDVS